MLDPKFAAHVLGVKFELVEELGKFGNSKNRFEVAGAINRQKKLIQVSKMFLPEVMRFTGAHEIGHWVLHPNEVMHRDRPMSGPSAVRGIRGIIEQEADYFAACYLMPPNLLRLKIKQTFDMEPPIRVNDDIAFWLCPDEPDELLRPRVDLDIREHILAGATSFQGQHFDSLAEQFHVSQTAMAIRLKEIDIFAQ